MSLETLMENMNQSQSLTTNAHIYNDPLSLDEVFPIVNEEVLNSFENKIKSDKDFRTNVVSY